MTQGRKLIELLKKKPMSYLEMNLTGISVSPHRRIAESLAPGEVLIKTKTDGRVKWRVKTVRMERS